MTMPLETTSEAGWSAASSTILDTRSEPPRCYRGKEADAARVMRATASAHEKASPLMTNGAPPPQQSHPPQDQPSTTSPTPMSLSSKLESNKQCGNNSVTGNGASSSRKSRASVGRKSTKSKAESKSESRTSGSAADGSRKTKKSQKSSRSASSASDKDATASTRKKKSPSVSTSTSKASSHKQQTSPSQSSTAGRSSKSKADSTKADSTKAESRANRTRGSRDTDKIASQQSDQRRSRAIVPAQPPRRPPPSSHRLLDPPSAESTSGSSSSTEERRQQAEQCHNDPPPSSLPSSYSHGASRGQRSGASSSHETFAYADVYAPRNNNNGNSNEGALATWEGGRTRRSLREEESHMMDMTTLPSHASPYGAAGRLSSMGESLGTGGSSGSSSSSASSRSCSRISEGSEEESLSDSEDDEEEETASGGDREGELTSAAGRALAIRDQGERSDQGSYDDDDEFKNAHALVQSDFHGGVDSLYEGDEEGGGALVEGKGYLSKAVDNHQAIVPIDSAIYEAYDHTFVTCPEHLRFRFLYTFLKKNLDKKVMIFFSTSNSAKFHAKLLGHFHVPALTMHGQQSREKFVSRFLKFSDWDTGILCATDAAGRDLDIPPSVDWLVQFEPPDDPSEFILRVARISCDSDRVGRSLLFLNPGEQGFLKYYHSASIPVSEFEIPKHKLADVQTHIEYHVNENERLLTLSRDAYGSYLIAYASHGFRDVYNVHDLNKSDVASAFGLVGLHSTADDLTLSTDTVAVSTFGGAGEGVPTRSSSDRGGGGGAGSGSGSGSKKSWQKEQKPQSKSWMRGEKSWPHSQIKLHPKFKESDVGR